MDRDGLTYVLEQLKELGLITTHVKPSGANHIGFGCIFPYRHESGEDRNPSMTASVDDEGASILRCHACGWRGTLLDAITSLSMSHKTVLPLWDWVNRNDGQRRVDFAPKVDRDYTPTNYSTVMKEIYRDPIPQEGIEFLKQKGCDEKIARKMGVGWIHDRVFEIHGKDVRVVDAIFLPTISRVEGNLICVGAQARRRQTYKGSTKYFTVLPYQSGLYLFGENLLPGATRKRLFVVEGQLDCMHMMLLGEHCVAAMGLYLSREKVAKIKIAMPRVVYVLLDPDKYGQRKTDNMVAALEKEGLAAKALRTEKDPKELTKEDLQKMIGGYEKSGQQRLTFE